MRYGMLNTSLISASPPIWRTISWLVVQVLRGTVPQSLCGLVPVFQIGQVAEPLHGLRPKVQFLLGMLFASDCSLLKVVDLGGSVCHFYGSSGISR